MWGRGPQKSLPRSRETLWIGSGSSLHALSVPHFDHDPVAFPTSVAELDRAALVFDHLEDRRPVTATEQFFDILLTYDDIAHLCILGCSCLPGFFQG